MPRKSTEERRAYARAYYLKNRDAKILQAKMYKAARMALDPAGERAKDCAKTRAWQLRNPDKVTKPTPEQRRRAVRKNRGGLDNSGVVQVGPCEICGTVCDPLHWDHDHTSGQFRGWLCGFCNRGLGQFKDSVANLEAALRYLQRSACRAA